MRKKNFVTLLCAAALLLFPACAGALPEQPSPDPVQAANDFITGLTGGSPASLGYAADASDLVSIGKLVLEGNHGEAMNKVGEFTAGKMIGASAPAVGQIIALGKIGKMAGDAAANWVGQKNFEQIYNRMLEVVGPVEKWPKDRARAKRDDFFQAVMAAEYRYLETYLIKNGYAKNRTEAEDVAVDMILAKGRFESLCDVYDLTGKDRTLAVLEREIRIEAEVAAEIARDKELARVARLEEERKAKEKEQAEKKEGKPVEEKQTSALPAPSMPEDYPQQIDPATQKPAAPPEATKPAAQTEVTKPEPAPAPVKPAPSAPEVPIRWTVTPRLMDKESTSFAITVMNVSGKPIPGFAVSLAPLNQSLEGGVGWGSPPSPGTLAPGVSVTVTALAMGDAEGIALSFAGGGKSLGSFTALSVHSTEKSADGTYQGTVTNIGKGTIILSVSGRSARAVITGHYTVDGQNVKISAGGSGTYDPRKRAVSMKWAGTSSGYMLDDGERYDVNERVSGNLSGSFHNGAFSGKWWGGSEFVILSGEWIAR
ncbi:MAG: hypothetical protein PHS90_05475 [Synergistaceae bacterium]|nr:hypothetical protein [Synergistaceae bacterium]